MKNEFEKFTISQVAILIRNNKCLILEFAGSFEKWGLPGGRLDKGETRESAFRREIKEELGLNNFDIIDVVGYDIWYTKKGVPVCGIANLIENDSDKIVLSHEHIKIEWVSEDELEDYNFTWPSAKKMIKKGLEYYRLLNKNK